jgi:hypothetical protein
MPFKIIECHSSDEPDYIIIWVDGNRLVI